MFKKTYTKIYKELRKRAVEKNRWSMLRKTLLSRSIGLNCILFLCWVYFLIFTGMQIYHRQFLLYLFLVSLSPLLQVYTLVFIYNYFKSKRGLAVIAKSNLLEGGIKKVKERVDYIRGQSITCYQIEITFPNGTSLLTPAFVGHYTCRSGDLCYVFFKETAKDSLLGVIDPNAKMAICFDRNFSIDNFIAVFAQHVFGGGKLVENRQDSSAKADQKVFYPNFGKGPVF